MKVKTTLSSEMAKTFLANSITLTPGTLTVDVDGQDLYIHSHDYWIDYVRLVKWKKTPEKENTK